MVVAVVRHRHEGVHLADGVHPFLHPHHVGGLPFQETAHEEEVAEHEGIGEEEAEEIAAAVVRLQDFFQLGEGGQGVGQGCLHLPALLAPETAPGDEAEYLRVGDELVAQLSAVAVYLVEGLLADGEHHGVLYHHPPQGDVGRQESECRQQYAAAYADNQQPADDERNLRSKPARHFHRRYFLHGICHGSGVYLPVTQNLAGRFCRHAHLQIVQLGIGWLGGIRHLVLVSLPEGEKVHPPACALLFAQFSDDFPSPHDFPDAWGIGRGEEGGEGIGSACGNGAADAVVERSLAEDIEVEGVGMLWILVGFSRLERREVSLPCLQLVLVHLEQGGEMLRPFLVLVVEMPDGEVGDEARRRPHQPETRVAIQGEIAYRAGDDADEP